MFRNKIREIHDLIDQQKYLEKRLLRQVKKLDEKIQSEISKGFKRLNATCEIETILNEDFEDKKRQHALTVYVSSVNRLYAHRDGVWYRQYREESSNITVDMAKALCQELSEKLDVNIQLDEYSCEIRKSGEV